jgi:hypothetical protein
VVAVGSGSALAAVTPMNEPPPAGAILDLNGKPIVPKTAETYTVDFTGAAADTTIAFAFRDDPAFIEFTNASVVDLTTQSGNLLKNGGFSLGVNTDAHGISHPKDWTYTNISGVSFGGYVSTNCGGGAYCWMDGAVRGYDEISQAIATTIGNTYQVSFTATEISGLTNWARFSTNGNKTDAGGNGLDILAFERPPIPEPSTWGMMLVGFAALGYLGYRRRETVAPN